MFKHLRFITISLLLLCISGSTWANGTKVGDLYYTFSGTDATVTYPGDAAPTAAGANSYTGAIVIPATVEYGGTTYNVVKIGDNAFRYSTVTSLTMNEGIVSCGTSSFNNMTEITELTFPNSFTTIGSGDPLCGCTKLTKVTFGTGMAKVGQGFCFSGTTLTDLYCYGETPATIGGYFMAGCQTATIHVLETVVDVYTSKWSTIGWGATPNIVGDIEAPMTYSDLQTQISTFESYTRAIGTDPGYFIASSAEDLISAIASAKALGESESGETYKAAFNSMNTAKSKLETNPIVAGYYYFESGYKAGSAMYGDANDADNYGLKYAPYNSADNTFLWLVTPNGSNWNVQNVGNGMYISTSDDWYNCSVHLTETPTVAQIITLAYPAEYHLNNTTQKKTYYALASTETSGNIFNWGYNTPGNRDTWHLRKIAVAGEVFESEDGIRYIINDDLKTLTVTKKLNDNGESVYTGDVVIPAVVQYKGISFSVSTIGEESFKSSNMNSLIISEGITTIEGSVFNSCTIATSLKIPSTVTTISGAGDNGIHASIPKIYIGTPELGSQLTKINGSFMYSATVTDVYLYASVPPTTVGGYAFSGMPKFHVLNSVLSDYQNCSWAKNGWGNARTFVGDALAGLSFYANGIKYIINDDQVSVKVTYTSDTAPEAAGVNNYTGDITIPDAVEYAGISFAVTALDTKAFAYSTITSISVGNNVKTIGGDCCARCSSLTSATLGSGVTKISQGFGYSSNNLSVININATTVPTGALYLGGSSSTRFVVPETLISGYLATKYWEDYNIYAVVDGLCYYVKGKLKEAHVTFPTGHSNPNTYTGNLVIPDYLTFGEIQYPVTKITSNAFAHSSISSLVLGNNITTTEGDACAYISTLKNITLGKSLTTIAGGFAWSSGVKNVVAVSTASPNWNGNYNFSSTPTIYVPTSSYDSYDAKKKTSYWGTLKTYDDYVTDKVECISDNTTIQIKDVTTAELYSKAITEKASATITSVDLRTANITSSVLTSTQIKEPQGLGKNTLFYLPESYGTTDASNVVVGNNCAQLVLTDKETFAPAIEFTATNATYAKTLADGGWYSCVLPYQFTIPEGVTVLNNASISGNTITFDEVTGSVAANTPFLYKKADGGAIAFEAANAAVNATAGTSGKLNGTYAKIPAGSATGKLILNSTGSAFAEASATASIPAFRAYMDAVAGSNIFTIVINDDVTGVASFDADGNVDNTPVDVYSVDGKLVRKGVNPVTALQGLESGIYIVNGKKIKK